MKEKNPSNKQSAKPTGKTANIFLNVIIVLLAGLIIFMSYSLFTKIKTLSSGDGATEPQPSKCLMDVVSAVLQIRLPAI